MHKELKALVGLYNAYFPPLHKSYPNLKDVLHDFVTMYSAPIVELAMVEAIYQDRVTLNYVMRLLLKWKKQGHIVLSYTDAFYQEITKKTEVPVEVQQHSAAIAREGSSLPRMFSPEEIEQELQQIEGILRVLSPERKAMLCTEAAKRVPKNLCTNEDTYHLLVRAALWELVREQYLV
jgi:hypothetical protein